MSGFFYKFHGSEFVFGSPPRVRIWEIGEQTLELIQVNDQLWKSDLSPRFKKLHSLWYHLESRTVLVRPKAFDDRRVILIASEGSEGRIHSVPRHNQSLPVKRLIENMPDYDWFLEPSTGLVSCISKFCPKTMLEALYCASAKMVLIRLPKFSLSFKRLDDGSFESEDFRGYRLASFQQLDYLPHFSQYLMLEPIDCRDATLAPKKLLVAQGNVTILPRIQESVSIALPNCDDGVSVHVYSYELHPRLELWEANSIASRLHLANIFTASNSFFPDRGLKMSGSQAAIELLRQCYINRPLSSEEAHHLDAVFTIGGPEIKIICHRLHVANSRLGFLYSKNIFSSLDSTSQRLRDSETHYRKVSADQTPRNEFRQGLNEEEWALPKFSPALFDRDFKLKLDLSPCLERKFCHHIEQSISALLGKLRPIHTDQDLPLGLATEGLLDHDISRDLLQSWKHFSISSIAELSDCTRISHLFSYYRDLVKQKREEAESWIHRSLSDCALRHSSAFRLLHTVDRVPSTTLTDIIRGSFDEKSLSSLNPYLSIEDSNALKDTILFYMELCVLEDKLVRLCWLGGDPLNTTKVINELSSIRVWDINKHPRWLAFEVENRLQIRQEQYKIAKHLVSYPGSICQLNMGLGKTRVILPMIVLEVLHQAHIANKLPRIHILRPLLAEFLDYIQLCLGAGLMRVRILYQPFHRDVNLTVPQVRAMWQEIDRALHSGGVQVVSVEDRMSLSLKFVELATSSSDISKNIAKELKQLLDKSDKVCVNVFDESDATLSHKLQLIYAVGNPRPLEHAVLRAEMSQAVLRVLNRPTPAIEEILNSDAFVICGKSKNLGSFQPMVF